MKRERIYLFDTTLRDGAQTQNVDFNVEEKTVIARALDTLGLDYVEGGFPGANPTDTAFFDQCPPLEKARLTAFGMTRRPGRSAGNDPSLSMVLAANTPAVCLVGKTWDFHIDTALKISLAENIELIRDSIAEVVKRNREALFDAEHFFDGYKANPEFALECIQAAFAAGARWIVLCDTNGGTLPMEIARIIGEVIKHIPGENLGIHAHNDTENAVANSLVAILAGVRQVHGSLNGLGERCGNANLVSLIPTLMLKEEFSARFETGLDMDNLAQLTHVSRLLDELLNRAPNPHAPYVGSAAFAHKGGLHASAVQKDPRTYEHIDPSLVGNKRLILVSDQAGRSSIVARLRDVGIDIDASHAKIGALLETVKQREYEGYSYDGAEASFELLARHTLGLIPEYFRVDSFRVLVERRFNAKGELVTVSEATVKVNVDGEILMSAGAGNGPVDALNDALRKDLGKYSEYIQDLKLVDYKVRILGQQDTGSVTRVLIESMDSHGNRWFTGGVSPNIVDASFQALYDAIIYKLFRDGAPAGNHLAPTA